MAGHSDVSHNVFTSLLGPIWNKIFWWKNKCVFEGGEGGKCAYILVHCGEIFSKTRNMKCKYYTRCCLMRCLDFS
jgi:hypothetical protein